MQIYFHFLTPILGTAGFLVVAGCTVWRKKKVIEDERRRRTLDNLRAALLD